jgi:hypothetical protein
MQTPIIDFDEASKEWHANKKKVDQCYKYICRANIGNTKRKCNKVCYKTSEYCYVHRNKDALKSEGNS